MVSSRGGLREMAALLSAGVSVDDGFLSCRLLLGAIWSLSPGPHSGWLKTAPNLLAYLAVCLPGDRLLRKKGETKG